jgi:hypothetical protein
MPCRCAPSPRRNWIFAVVIERRPTEHYNSWVGGGTKSHIHAVYLSLETLSDISNKLCGLEKTSHWATTYFALSRKTKDLVNTYQALKCLGDILLDQGDDETAMNVFQAVLDGSTEMDVHRRRADCMSRIGDISVRGGQPNKARDMWEAALPLFVRSSQAKDATAIERKLSQWAREDLAARSEIPGPGIPHKTSGEGEIMPIAEQTQGKPRQQRFPPSWSALGRPPTSQRQN